jgi:hypothetical protein
MQFAYIFQVFGWFCEWFCYEQVEICTLLHRLHTFYAHLLLVLYVQYTRCLMWTAAFWCVRYSEKMLAVQTFVLLHRRYQLDFPPQLGGS